MQSVHVSGLVAAEWLENFPAWQNMHIAISTAPVELEKDPGGQFLRWLALETPVSDEYSQLCTFHTILDYTPQFDLKTFLSHNPNTFQYVRIHIQWNFFQQDNPHMMRY